MPVQQRVFAFCCADQHPPFGVCQADLFFHKYYNIQTVRSRREKQQAERRLRKHHKKLYQAEDDTVEDYVDDDDLFTAEDGGGGSEEDVDVEVNVDDLFDKERFGTELKSKQQHAEQDDEPHGDGIYSYEQLAAAMDDEDVAGDSDLAFSDAGSDLEFVSDDEVNGSDELANGGTAASDGLPSSEFPELDSGSDDGCVLMLYYYQEPTYLLLSSAVSMHVLVCGDELLHAEILGCLLAADSEACNHMNVLQVSRLCD